MDPVTGLSLGRIAIGAVTLAAPNAGARLFALDPRSNPQLGFMGRLFGAREIALGAVTLASKGALRRNLTLVGMAVDGADAASAVIETSQGSIPKMAGGPMIGVALGAVAAGGAALALSRAKD